MKYIQKEMLHTHSTINKAIKILLSSVMNTSLAKSHRLLMKTYYIQLQFRRFSSFHELHYSSSEVLP